MALSIKKTSTLDYYKPPSNRELESIINPFTQYQISKDAPLVISILNNLESIKKRCLPPKKGFRDLPETLKKHYVQVTTAISFILDQLAPFKNKKIQNELYETPSPLLNCNTVGIFREMLSGHTIEIATKKFAEGRSGIYKAKIGPYQFAAKKLENNRDFHASKVSSLLLGREDELFMQYLGFVDAKPYKIMLYKLYDTDLFALSTKPDFSRDHFTQAIHDVARALFITQRFKKRIYCDLKSENIYLDHETSHFVLGDYDDSIKLINNTSKYRTTDAIAPPEVSPDSICTDKSCKHNSPITGAFDIWSFGIVIMKLLSYELLNIPRDKHTLEVKDIFAIVEGFKNKKYKKDILERIRLFDPKYHYIRLALTCLKHDPAKRPSIEFLLRRLANIESFYSSYKPESKTSLPKLL